MGQDGRHRPGSAGCGDRTVLAIGIDNLGMLEELFGEDLAEEVVATLGRRLAAAMPHGAGLCITRQRRFVLDLPRLGNADAADLFGQLQAAACAGAIPTAAGPVAVTLSGGCASTGAEACRPEMAERAALQTLQQAMAGSVGAFRIAPGERALVEQRARLLEASRAAIGALGQDGAHPAGGLRVAFQPVVRAEGGRTISFHECLVRIRQPDGSLTPACDFMPALERLGLAPLIDRQVLATTFDTLAHHPSARLSVNVFPQTMQDAGWMALFEEAAARDPGLPERLIVELTETSSMLDPTRTIDFMDRLRRHGTAFALDDFGAGHTSLAYLRDFRFDMLKIDGQFIRGIRPDSDAAFFVETVVGIARRFDMLTVAESVQGPAEARCLYEIGIDSFQGFWFGCPSLVLEPTPSPMPGVAAQA